MADDVTNWRKSSLSAYNGNCAEVGSTPGAVCVRDSKHPHSPVLTVSASTWRQFTSQLKTR